MTSSYLPALQEARAEYVRLTKIAEQLYVEVKTGLDQKKELETEIESSSKEDAASARGLSKFQESLNTQKLEVCDEVRQLQELKSGLEISVQDLTGKLATAEFESNQKVSETNRDDSFAFEEEQQKLHYTLAQVQMAKESYVTKFTNFQKEKINYNDQLLQLEEDLDYIITSTTAKELHIRELTLQAEKEEQQLENMHVSLETISHNGYLEGGDSLFSEVERNYDEVMKKLINMVGYYKLVKQEKAKFAVQLVKLKQVCLFLETSKENAENNLTKCVTSLIRNLKNPRHTSLYKNLTLLPTVVSTVTHDNPKFLTSVHFMEPMIHKIKNQIEDCELQLWKEKESQLQLCVKQMQCCQRTFYEETRLLLLRCKNLKLKIQVTTNNYS